MYREWEAVLGSWASPPSPTEQAKCGNAEGMIRKAIGASPQLQTRSIRVFPQGSFRNCTNVVQESDVDVCVLCTDSRWCDYPFAPGISDASLGFTPATYSYSQFKLEVWGALRTYFGEGVSWGNKAFDIHENTYRVDADVVPCFEYRQYSSLTGPLTYQTGTAFAPDRGFRIHNWPEQHYSNGVLKNEGTRRAFKQMVRVIKRLRNEMAERGSLAAKPIPSYLIECLVYNLPAPVLAAATWTELVRMALAHLIVNLGTDQKCVEWREVNELKYLMRPGQPWTRAEAYTFAIAAWQYIGF